MRVGVVDVGSNTVRLLVAERTGSGLEALAEDKAYVGLGAEILQHGSIRATKLAEAVAVAAKQAKRARAAGVERLEIVVAAPGRQAANADELVDALARATKAPVVPLSADEEAVLAYTGAMALSGIVTDSLAVCDVGGGSTEIAIGAPPAPPSWLRSIDVGALRLTAAWVSDDPPASFELEAVTAAVSKAFAGITPPRPRRVIAVGGSARGVAKLVGPRLDGRELDAALVVLARHPAAKIAKGYGIDVERARLLAAGAVILREVVRRLGVPLELGRGGLREGVLLSLLADSRAA